MAFSIRHSITGQQIGYPYDAQAEAEAYAVKLSRAGHYTVEVWDDGQPVMRCVSWVTEGEITRDKRNAE